MTDDDLDVVLTAARKGDEWAATQLYRALHPHLISYLRAHAPDVADDLASETWLGVAAGLPRFSGTAAEFRGWLFTIARRRAVDHFRARARRPLPIPLEDYDEMDVGAADDHAIERLSTERAIRALVRDLPGDQAEVVLLRAVADLSVAQVAQIMERSEGAVRLLQHRAIRKLAKVWEHGAVTR